MVATNRQTAEAGPAHGVPEEGLMHPEHAATMEQAAAMARGADCPNCPLDGCGRGPVPSKIVGQAPIIFIGEAPGNEEVRLGENFVGTSGRILDECIEAGGLTRAEVSIANALLCQPPEELQTYLFRLRRDHASKLKVWRAAKKRARMAGQPIPKAPQPLVLPMEACAGRLRRDLEESASRVIAPVGGPALRQLCELVGIPHGRGDARAAPGKPRSASIRKQHGAPILLEDGRIIVPSLHPAFALHGERKWMHSIRQMLTRAVAIARRGRIQWVEPTFKLDLSEDEAINLCDRLRESGAEITFDIETDGRHPQVCRIRDVGVGATIKGREIVACITFRNRDGHLWWSSLDATRRVGRAMARLLTEADLIGHNINQFDIPVCEREKLITVRGKRGSLDTLLAHRCTRSSEMPHDLGFVLAETFDCPRHKEDADAKYVGEVSDEARRSYNLKDVHREMRLAPILRQNLYNWGSWDVYEMDSRLSVLAREMTRLGVGLDRGLRLSLFEQLRKEALVQEASLRKIVGDPDFNPNSFQQVGRFLYGVKGYVPRLATDGKEWDEEKSPSTSEAALYALLDSGVDKQTDTFINALFELRAVEKLRSTYVGINWLDELDEPVPLDDPSGRLMDIWRRDGYLRTHAIEGVEVDIMHVIWKACATTSGRWTSNVNWQNHRKRGRFNVRKLSRAVPGHIYIGADAKALELRITAVETGDPLLFRVFREGRVDPHSMNAATLLTPLRGDDGRPLSASSRAQITAALYKKINFPPSDPAALARWKEDRDYWRNLAKRVSYGEQNGMQWPRLFEVLSTDRLEDGARAFPNIKITDVYDGRGGGWHERWHALHPSWRLWQQRLDRGVRREGYIATGKLLRRRAMLGGYELPEELAHRIQGTAADLANEAHLRLDAAIPVGCWSPWTGPVIQVHDQHVYQVPIARAEEARAIFEKVLPSQYSGMDFPWDVKVGLTWADV